jgi:hypothetical protein
MFLEVYFVVIGMIFMEFMKKVSQENDKPLGVLSIEALDLAEARVKAAEKQKMRRRPVPMSCFYIGGRLIERSPA